MQKQSEQSTPWTRALVLRAYKVLSKFNSVAPLHHCNFYSFWHVTHPLARFSCVPCQWTAATSLFQQRLFYPIYLNADHSIVSHTAFRLHSQAGDEQITSNDIREAREVSGWFEKTETVPCFFSQRHALVSNLTGDFMACGC